MWIRVDIFFLEFPLMMHGESGVLRGGLGYFFLFQDQLLGREDLLRESKIADGAAMGPSRAADGVP